MKHPITKTRNGVQVYVDLIRSRAAANISWQPSLLGLVQELLEKTSTSKPEIRLDHDMGRAIGYAYVVETTEKDTILYAQRRHCQAFTRFVKNGTPLATQYLTILLHRDEDGSYELQDAWIGRLNPASPGEADETPNSKDYWTNHAVVLSGQAIQLRTLTKICPY